MSILSEHYQHSFSSLERVFGSAAMPVLAQAHFCVIGIGGVGSWAAEALARSGIGNITLIDFDSIELSNINRQVHTTNDTLNISKVASMQQRILAINPECNCQVIEDFITHANLASFKLEQYDYVIDAIDHVTYKTALLHFCRRYKVPIVSTGGAGGLTDPTAIAYADLTKTNNDALLAKVRSNLRYQYGYSRNPKRSYGIDCVYSTQQSLYPAENGSVSYQKPKMDGAKTLDCATGLGSFVAVTASFGFAGAARAINKYLAKKKAG